MIEIYLVFINKVPIKTIGTLMIFVHTCKSLSGGILSGIA